MTTNEVELHKAKIFIQASKAVRALAELADATEALGGLLYSIPYADELHPMHTDVTENAYRQLGDFTDVQVSLQHALGELKAEVA
jgi:hypothetical protein